MQQRMEQMKEQVLKMLEADGGYVSGEYLSRMLGVSRTAVWKVIKRLREEGYIIDSVTNKGYCLKGKPDFLDAGYELVAHAVFLACNQHLLTGDINTAVIGTKIEVLKTVDSTNEEIKRRASNGAKSGLIIAAECQTGGKGRFGRKWESESGEGIYFTFLLRPGLPPADIASITLAAGYAVCEALREYSGVEAKIKWPNDIVINNKKVCGILTEMAAQMDMVDYVAVGIGINVNNKSFSEDIKWKSTSVFIETGKLTERNLLFREVIKKLDLIISEFLTGIPEERKTHFKELCITLGRSVTAMRGGTEIKGTAVDVSSGGDLIIRQSSGELVSVNSGEVVVQGIY